MTIIWYGKGPSGADVEVRSETDGNASTIAAAAGALDASLKAAGFKPGDRFAKPAAAFGGGGGGKGRKPDLEPPAGIVVPPHCDEPMKYIRYKSAGAKGHEGRGVPPGEKDMFVCRKDRECEDVKSGKSERPFATFDMKRAKPETPAAPPAPPTPPTAPATGAPTPMAAGPLAGAQAWDSFNQKMKSYGYQEDTLREIARGIPIQVGVTTRAQLQELIERMKKLPRKQPA